jgi:hypothetical protein
MRLACVVHWRALRVRDARQEMLSRFSSENTLKLEMRLYYTDGGCRVLAISMMNGNLL